ncbi:aldo/keto reductase [Staphylococcus argenteus]|uniref:aldo/keto reductase n=1 Tax=Staphylococcus argenteus TaxID=985002 RepID=UPI001EFD0251|nr:aldo/keto reductase [Staphylococcus argenteus]MCG9802783.1 aldo/keto reductase [Staphylococcus argenteus]MCG9810777.1 aldo/keto reductase [Staphylococcus argenteus]MCG9822852.1 aldo/keto reductase [Staphylococcus argenteus]
MEVKRFYNGNEMPQIGLGTFRVENDENCMKSVKHAIEQGYRSIDTAKVYGNEEQVGAGIRAGLESTGLNREDLFITSKLYFEDFGRNNVANAYHASLSRLGLSYLDLYLVHWPGTNEAIMIDTWKGMEDLYKNNEVRNIGVSNFEPEHLEALLAQVSIKPVINQVEFHPYLTQHKLKLYLEAQHIVMESWSPLMNAQILEDETIIEIAKEVGKSAAQVVIRWNIQHGVVTIPKSVTPERITENINIFDFKLTDEQMMRIDALNQDRRIGPDPKTFEG